MLGEKTSITVRTYKEKNETKAFSENVLNTFSESSTNELERLVEDETGLSTTNSQESSSTYSNSQTGSVSFNASGSFN
ncbi:hypothetical protein AB4865_00210 [Capnocytophaga sp. ARDL2]|uniref:hypothetical protein n=1 Tax=Capnocytophaga sp. ARDL2 TaxID=3238809 RepID=UPI0035563BA4